MINYKITKVDDDNNPIFIAKIDGDKFSSFPCDLENSHYGEYLKWVEDGNTPLQPDPL